VEIDREELANDLQERATRDNGRRKKIPVDDEIYEYQGHYDFEPEYKHHDRAHHPLKENHEETDVNEQ